MVRAAYKHTVSIASYTNVSISERGLRLDIQILVLLINFVKLLFFVLGSSPDTTQMSFRQDKI